MYISFLRLSLPIPTEIPTRWHAKSDMSAGAYVVYEAAGNIPDPEWPDLTFKEIVGLAFKDRVVSSLDHPLVKRLRGE